MRYSDHFKGMLKERAIDEAWIERVCSEPEKVEDKPDGTRHFLRKIPEHGNRWLRVVVNITVDPHKAVTAFFDRRLKGKV